jgi:hypothetical protein
LLPAKPCVIRKVDAGSLQALVGHKPDVLGHVPVVGHFLIVASDIHAEDHPEFGLGEAVLGQSRQLKDRGFLRISSPP